MQFYKHPDFTGDGKYASYDSLKDLLVEDDGTSLKKFHNILQYYKHPDFTGTGDYADFDNLQAATYSKYSTEEKEGLKSQALDGIRNLYRGGFNKLLNNRDKLATRIAFNKERINDINNSVGIHAASGEVAGLISDNKNLTRAAGLLAAYDGIMSAKKDIDFDHLIEGRVPLSSMEDNPDNVNWGDGNPFLRQIMPTAEYKVLELGGKSPSVSEAFLPEYSRRDRAGEGGFSQTIGALKDAIRLPGRALRPLGENAVGIETPGLSYWEEFARPDKYKTPGQEMFDEIGSFQGLGGAGSKLAGMKLTGVFPRAAKAINRSKYGKFLDPADVVLNRVLPGAAKSPSAVNQAGYAVAKELPNIGLDVAYEGTKPSDEKGSMLAAGLGGTIGSAVAPFIRRGASDLLSEATGSNPLRSEILAGTPTVLNEELKLAKMLSENIDLTSKGGRAQLSGIDQALGDSYDKTSGSYFPGEIGRVSKERNALARDLDDRVMRENKNRPAELEAHQKVWEDAEILAQEHMLPGKQAPFAVKAKIASDLLRERGLSPHPRVPSDELMATAGLPGKYVNEVAGTIHPSKQARVVDELSEATGVDIRNIDKLKEGVRKTLSQIPNAKFSDRISLERAKELSSKIDEASTVEEILAIRREIVGDIGPQRANNYSREGFTMSSDMSPPGVERAFDARTKLRKYGEGEGPTGTDIGLFGETERIQAKVMNDFLSKTPAGKRILGKHADIAKLYGLKDKLPDLTDGTKVDAFLEKIGRSRMNISTKANAFADMIDLQKELSKATGKEVDFITPAVLRRVQNKSFWNDHLGSAGTPAMVAKALTIAKDITWAGMTGGKFRSLVDQIAKRAMREEDKTRQKQKGTGRNTQYEEEVSEAASLLDDPKMQEIIRRMNRKNSGRKKLSGS